MKGQGVEELGKIAAKAFREVFNATAASLFLREDLLPAKAEGESLEKENFKEQMEDTLKSRHYTLWGTDIDKKFAEKSENKEKFEEFRKRVGILSYQEGEGKTGWVVKYRAAMMAYYDKKKNKVTVIFPKKPIVKDVNTNKAGDENINLPPEILAHDPLEVERIVNIFRKQEETEGKNCEVKTSEHNFLLMAPLIDPDTSPEPIGVVRLILTDVDHKLYKESEEPFEEFLYKVAKFARRFSRLMRPALARRSTLRTMTDIVEHSNKPYDVESKPGANQKPVEELPGGIVTAGPYGRVASSLLGFGEASAVSVFVHKDYAPKTFRGHSSDAEYWILVGAAAATDALTDSDTNHFKNKFCQEYFINAPGKCRYEAGVGRTGDAIKSGKRSHVELISSEEHMRSEYLCEVQSPNALLIIPTPEKNDFYHSKDKEEKIIAAVRFVRTEERRRAKFLPQEKQQLASVIQTLRWLVPSWAEQNDLREFQEIWKKESHKYFPCELQNLLKKWLEKDNQKIESLARGIKEWFFSDSEEPPQIQNQNDVEKNEKVLLAWFINTLDHPTPDASMTDIIAKVVRALIRIHWGPAKASVWVEKLDHLERFEPVLSEIPHYRDHSVHQFQVFLVGWLLLRELEENDIYYPGWSQISDNECNGKGDSDRENLSDVKENSSVNASAWVLASIFHDVAYPLQHVYTWANLFGIALTSTRPRGIFCLAKKWTDPDLLFIYGAGSKNKVCSLERFEKLFRKQIFVL